VSAVVLALGVSLAAGLASATTSPPGHAQIAKKKCKKRKHKCKPPPKTVVNPPAATVPGPPQTARPPQTATLTVLRNPGFGGSVTSTPTGIDCGSSCTSRFDLGTAVVLSTQNAPGYRHSDWSGGGCAGNGVCDLTLDVDTTVTAVWVARVTVNVDSNPSGADVSVDSSSAFKACSGGPPTTSCIVDDGDSVTVTANGGGFLNWTGDCSGSSNPLTFTATAPGPINCTASYT
jgi:hypothetical protein